MAPAFNFSFFRPAATVPNDTTSIHSPAPSTTLVPTPLRILKRGDRSPSSNNRPPQSTLAEPAPQRESSTFSDYSFHRPFSYPRDSTSTLPASTYHSALSLPLMTISPIATASLTNVSTNVSTTSLPPTCSLCTSPVFPLQTYTFPRTAPAVTAKVLRLFPKMKASPTFCGTCFEAIHAVHLCWGCGDPVHREEERVGCGWAWWHWGCLRCLICRVCGFLLFVIANSTSAGILGHTKMQAVTIQRIDLLMRDLEQAPLPPPTWTCAPITLPVPPSCKACTRELQHLAYQERKGADHHIHIRRRKRTSSQRLLQRSGSDIDDNDNDNDNDNGIDNVYDGPASRRISLGTKQSLLNLRSNARKVSLGMKYPPLPRWMIRPQPSRASAITTTASASRALATGNEGVLQPPAHLPKWMEKLPGNRKGWRKPSSRMVSGGGVGKAKGAGVAKRGDGGRVVSRGGGRGFWGGRLVV